MPIRQERMITMIEALKECKQLFEQLQDEIKARAIPMEEIRQAVDMLEYANGSESLSIVKRANERARAQLELIGISYSELINRLSLLAELPRASEIALVREDTHFRAYAKRNEYARRAMERKRGGPGMTSEQKSLYYKSLREVREQEEFMERVRKELEVENETGTDGE